MAEDLLLAHPIEEKRSFFRSFFIPWHILIVVILVVMIAYGLLYPTMSQAKKADIAIGFIEEQTITEEDVFRNVFSTEWSEEDLKAHEDYLTWRGVHENDNFIRDDAEHYLLQRYAEEPHLRAAALQYSQALHFYFWFVFDERTANAAERNYQNARACIQQTARALYLDDIAKQIEAADEVIERVEYAEFNDTTGTRKQIVADGRAMATMYTTNRSAEEEKEFEYLGDFCDVDVSSFVE